MAKEQARVNAKARPAYKLAFLPERRGDIFTKRLFWGTVTVFVFNIYLLFFTGPRIPAGQVWAYNR
jgi:hypothetical protein